MRSTKLRFKINCIIFDARTIHSNLLRLSSGDSIDLRAPLKFLCGFNSTSFLSVANKARQFFFVKKRFLFN